MLKVLFDTIRKHYQLANKISSILPIRVEFPSHEFDCEHNLIFFSKSDFELHILPTENAFINMHPDFIIWSRNQDIVHIIELISFEDNV